MHAWRPPFLLAEVAAGTGQSRQSECSRGRFFLIGSGSQMQREFPNFGCGRGPRLLAASGRVFLELPAVVFLIRGVLGLTAPFMLSRLSGLCGAMQQVTLESAADVPC